MLLMAFLAVGALELLLWLQPLWRSRRLLSFMAAALLAAVSAGLLVSELHLWTVVLLIFSVYRIINLGRVFRGRIQQDYLYHAARLTSFWLVGLQLVVIGLAGLTERYSVRMLIWLYLIACGQLAVGLILGLSLRRHLKTTLPPRATAAYADHELPSLTVAIPARNETADLEICLRSLVTSDYPKLEVIVLDDCSQNKRTPELIRDFAQAGVRFLAGEAPPDHWLAKNYAYSQLATAANGDVLLFCGVDTRFEPGSLRRLVTLMLQKNKTMISLLPANSLPDRRSVVRRIIQSNRYAWELALPRRLLQRPPVLSTCWLISREALKRAGGFAAVSRKVIPESYFARQTAAHNDGYSFLRSDKKGIDIASHKSLDEQQATTLRTRYPQLHRRPEMVALVSLAQFSALLWPLAIFTAGLIAHSWGLALLAGTAYLLSAVAYGAIARLTYNSPLAAGLWLLPVAVIYDISVLNYSMWEYEFGEVLWKGRNVCIPVMRLTEEPEKA